MLRERKVDGAPRIELVNLVTNNVGQMLLTLSDGDWDLALSVATSLLASACAQAAVKYEESAEALFDEIVPSARIFVLAFEKQLVAEPNNPLTSSQ